MKKLIKQIVIIFLVMIIIFIGTTNISKASFAEFDDETADAQGKKDLLEQQEKDTQNFGKSSNNYLTELSVKGYKLNPNFDKQIINYTIGQEITDESIEINAKTDDDRAKISGIGNIKLQPGENNLKIDITAENGSVRSYFIKVNKKTNPNENNENEKLETKSVAAPISKEGNTNSTSPNSNNENTATFIILGIVFVIIVLALLKPKKKRRAKKTRR